MSKFIKTSNNVYLPNNSTVEFSSKLTCKPTFHLKKH